MRPAKPAGWEERLNRAIEQASERDWSFGEHDCAAFAAHCAEACVGDRHVWSETLRLRAQEKTPTAVCRAADAVDIVELMSQRVDPIPTAAAMRGDIIAVLVDRRGRLAADGSPALGVCEGATLLVAAHPSGLRRYPMSAAIAAWPLDPV